MAWLTNARVLWMLALFQVLIWIGFVSIMKVYDFLLIDEMWNPDEIAAHISALSEQQKRAHIWTTATLDVLYPIVYGCFFVGMSWRFFGRPGRWLAVPGIATVPFDLTEGVIQIMALSGRYDVIVHKAWATPWKLGLFITASVITLAALAVAIRRKFSPAQSA